MDRGNGIPHRQPDRREHQAMRGLFNSAGMTVLLFLLCRTTLQLPILRLRRIMPLFMQHLFSYIVYALAMIIAIMVGIYFFGCGSRFALPAVPVRRDYMLPALGVGLGVAVGGSVVAVLIGSMFSGFGLYFPGSSPSFTGGPATVLLVLVCSTLLPALLEEMLFRGVLLQPLRCLGDGAAVLISALLFALCHGTLPQMITAFCMGLCLGVFTVRTGSLYTAMAIHLVYNSIVCAAGMLTEWIPALTAPVNLAVILLLAVVGVVSAVVLRSRFGAIWQLKRSDVPAGSVFVAAVSSPPMIAVLPVCIAVLLQSMR